MTTGTTTIGTTVYPQVFGDPEVKYLGGSTFIYFPSSSRASRHRHADRHRSDDGASPLHRLRPYAGRVRSSSPRRATQHGQVSGGQRADALTDKEFADVDPENGARSC